MKKELMTISLVMMLCLSTMATYVGATMDVTIALSDAELSTQFAKGFGPGTVAAIVDIAGPGVRFNLTGLSSSGTDISDNYPVSQLAGGALDSIGGWGNFRTFTQYRLVLRNDGPSSVSINLEMNTGWAAPIPQRNTYWESSWVNIGVGETRTILLSFDAATVWNAEDDPVAEWRYPGGTAGVTVRRLEEVSRIGFQVCGSGAASIVVSATIPNDVVLTLPDSELASQFSKESGPGTVTAVIDVAGPGVRFDFSGLTSTTGTLVGDDFPLSSLAGGTWKFYGSGFSGSYDFSGYSRYSLVFKNVGTSPVTINLMLNTGWTSPPWGISGRDTFWQNTCTYLGPEEARVVTLDFWNAEVWNAQDDPVTEWRFPDGTTGVIVRRLDEVSNIGFQVLGEDQASIMVYNFFDAPLTLSDTEMATQFAYEYGPGAVTIADIPGTGVRFDFTGLQPSLGTGVGDDFPVNQLAGGAYKTYGVTSQFSTSGDFSAYTRYVLVFTNVGPNPATVNLKMNTGWTIPPPEYAAIWRDTFWQTTWTYLAPGQSKILALNFLSAEVYNAIDEQEFGTYPDGTTGVAVWRLDEISDIGFQVLGEDTASIVVSGFGHPPEAAFTYLPAEPKAGQETIFDASSSNPNGGTIVSYEWDFGDGNTTTTSNAMISHTHDNPGIYNVSLKVTDSESFFDVFLEAVTVIPSAVYEHDVAIAGLMATPTILQIGDTVHITVTAKNLGNVTETFNVTTTYGSYSNVETVIDLLPEEQVTFSYDWLTSGETKCMHAISAVAEQVAGEVFTLNNKRGVGVNLVELIPPEATVKVEPALVKSLRFFDMNITINDLEEYWDMAGFDISLNYNTTMLDVIEVDLGEFATRFNLTFEIVRDINDPAGYVHLVYLWNIAELTPETRPTPYGSGTLFTARFYVTAVGTTELLLDTTIAAYPNPSKWCTDSSIPVKCLILSGTAKTALPIKEDVNADAKVDILDVVAAAATYGSRPDHPNWNPYADINGDGAITILDLVMITRVYGTIYDP